MQRAAEPQTIADALDWHAALSDSVQSHRAATMAAARREEHPTDPRLLGFTLADLGAFFDREQAEVDGLCTMSLVAAAEAALRDDYWDRVSRQFKDPLSRAYLRFHRRLKPRARTRPPFDESGILDVLKSVGVVPDHLVTDFRHVLVLRHWFAHGRYWVLRSTAARDTAAVVYAKCAALLAALPP